MQDQTCSRCNCELTRPYEQTANYVIGDDLQEDELREVHYAMIHTEKTEKELDRLDELFPDKDRQQLAAESASPHADETREVYDGDETVEQEGGVTETATHKEVPFSVDTEEFDHIEVATPEEVKHSEEIAHVYTTHETRPVQKTGLVCPDCTDSNDEIMWGEAA